jgi:ferredoxin-NADP reductase/predicted pyridoxine 5'-phosphate oxidase superfamily flavin-nucleotide-binding protein
MARAWMPDQHREFYAQLPFVVLGAVDKAGDVWATLRAGEPGFMHSPAPERLTLDLARDPDDPADAGIEDGEGIGMLGIELHTRRRNRLNGVVRRSGDTGFEIQATQAYGNCPQYIQLRQYAFVDTAPQPVVETTTLDAQARALIAGADSFYVASYVERDGARQVDASHRGGKPGFVHIAGDGTLTIPDFSGNLFFNTLGNFMLNPRAGLVFVDFPSGDLLQMTGRAEVLLDPPELASFVGAERMWRFKPRRILYRPAALPLRWIDVPEGASPNALITGDWADAAARQKAARLAAQWRPFRVDRVVEESESIRSFHLLPADDAGIPPALAGQHLAVRLALPGSAAPQLRTYTLSSAPSDPFLRISVKREGVFSRYLHDALRPGDLIEARAPAGSFTLDATVRRPVVMLAAGVGVTPLVSMARHLVREGLRTRYQRPVWLFQSARRQAQRAFGAEIDALVQSAQGRMRHIRVLSDPEGAEAGKDYDATGRITMELLKRTLPWDDYDFYLCGPAAFMQDMYDGLRDMHVDDARIHAEAFGPSSIKRRTDEGIAAATAVPVSTAPVPVLFMRTAKEARWTPAAGTLLELAEQRGLSPEFSCRSGSCGSCRTRVLSGAVTYAEAPTAEAGPDEALICRAMPAQGCTALHLDL